MKKLCVLLVAIMIASCCVLATACNTGVIIDPDKEHYVVGICQLVTHDALDSATQGFKDAVTKGLAEAGRTVEFDEQNAQGESNTCNTIVNNFVSKRVDLIMANATPALQSASNATLNIPILGTSVTEYGVALGLQNFNGTVGGNISGTSDLAPLDQQAQMIKTLFPSASKVAILYCSAEANSKYQFDVMKQELEKLNISVETCTFVDSNDIMQALTRVTSCNADVLYLPTDNTVASNVEIIDNACRQASLPVICGEEGPCKVCGVATLSISYYNLGYTTGQMAVEILLGQKDISTMAIKYDEHPVYKYNEEVCTRLGITTIPSDYTKIEK